MQRQPTFVLPESADQVLTMNCVTWAGYEVQLALRGDRAVPRIAYLDGTMELMSPSRDHEQICAFIGRLVETYALERNIDLSPYGSWTLRYAPKKAGVEPDECFIIGADQSAQRPHLAIEVIRTSGSIDKLEIYRRLRIPEVWFWQNEAITIYVLQDDQYRETPSSRVLPGLVLPELVTFLSYPTITQAIRAYRAALAALAVKP